VAVLEVQAISLPSTSILETMRKMEKKRKKKRKRRRRRVVKVVKVCLVRVLVVIETERLVMVMVVEEEGREMK
jgi:hypothetical protein